MHVLFLSDNFPPETNAPANRTHEHAREWVRQGHRVTVITCAPNYPTGRVHPGYTNAWLRREQIDGIDVVRVKTYLAANRGVVRRLVDFLSFAVAGFFAGLFQPRPDVVVGTSPQFFAACAAWALAVVKRRPFVFELRDLWPGSISAVGAVRSGKLLRAVERVELFLYRRARAIVAVTEAFRADLVARGIPRAKIAVIRGGVDTDFFRPGAEPAGLPPTFERRVVFGYCGTLGMAHALENVIAAAEQLANRKDIGFVLAGDGARRAHLEELIRSRDLDNIVVLGTRPRAQMPALWAACDVVLVHLADRPVFRTVLPSKIFEAFGCGRPVLLAGPRGEAQELLEGIGAWVPPEDPAALAEKVGDLTDDAKRRAEMALASARAARRFDRTALAREMLAVLEFVARRANGRPEWRRPSPGDATREDSQMRAA